MVPFLPHPMPVMVYQDEIPHCVLLPLSFQPCKPVRTKWQGLTNMYWRLSSNSFLGPKTSTKEDLDPNLGSLHSLLVLHNHPQLCEVFLF